MRSIKRCLAACVLLTSFAAIPAAHGQTVPVGDPYEDYARVLQLEGRAPAFSFSVRPIAASYLFNSHGTRHPWERRVKQYVQPRRIFAAGILTPEMRGFLNSERPFGTNDGAVWQGRGATAATSVGVFAKTGPLSVAFRPMLLQAQNADFELSPLSAGDRFSPFARATLASNQANRLSTIDQPQRFGDEPYQAFDPGQSYVRLGYRGIGLGVATENIWWGPATRNAISFSNNAAGVEQAFFGTAYPVDVGIGKLEGRWIWGRLHESDFFDDRSDNDERYLTALAVAFSPDFLPGWSLGATRTFHQVSVYDEFEFEDYFLVFQNPFSSAQIRDDNPEGRDTRDQLVTLFARWLIPQKGFEFYFEWGKGDHNWDFRDALVDFQHGGGYTFGFQKVIAERPTRWWRIQAEATKLEAPRSDVVRSPISGGYFYEHAIVHQGLTNRGQILGAGTGAGSNSQFFGVDVFTTGGVMGAFLNRVVYENDLYYRLEPNGEDAHQVGLGAGLRIMRFIAGFELEGSLAIEHLLNKYAERKKDETNLHLTIAVRRSLFGMR